MNVAIAAFLSAVGFYFSIGLGAQWWLLWLAPVPALWLAFTAKRPWPVFFAAWAAVALGATNLLNAYAGLLPPVVLAIGIAVPALCFAISVMGARRVFLSGEPLLAMAAFASLWTAFDFLASFDKAGGTMSSPANTEVAAPMLIQSASLFGYTAVTFLVGVVAAGLALSLATRKAVPALLAVALFAANAAFGYLSMAVPAQGTMRVALVESDDGVGGIRHADKARTLKTIDAYTDRMRELSGRGVDLVVLPENIARLDPAWRSEADAKLAAAADSLHATIVAGFNTPVDGAQRNVSRAYTPGTPAPVNYEKRRLVPGLETLFYTPGPGPVVLRNGIGLEICKDMDFQAMIRRDEVATHPAILAVPAWDFDKDDWAHARVAILRSVENGVPMARTARDGLLTLNDRYGRMVAKARSKDGFTVLVGELPLADRGGITLYDRIGDMFGWLCVVLGIGLYTLSFARRRVTA